MHVLNDRPSRVIRHRLGLGEESGGHLGRVSRRLRVRRAIAFLVSGGTLFYIALEGAGYDIVLRQELALAIWALVAVGFATGVLPRSRPAVPVLIALAVAAGLTAWMLLSLTWTDSSERTIAEIARLLAYLGMVTLALSSLNRFTFRAAAAGFSVAAVGIVAVAIASRLFPGSFESASEVPQLFDTDRLTYPLDYWNAIGAWGGMAAAIGLAWSAHARIPAIRAIALASVPVAGLAVYLSYSRGGVVGIAVALVAVLALSHNRWTALLHALAAGAGTGFAILAVREHDQIANATGGDGGATVALALLGAGAMCAVAVLLTYSLDMDRVRLPVNTARWAVPGGLAVATIAVVVFAGGPVSDGWEQFNNEDRPASGDDPVQRLTTAGGTRSDIWGSAIDAFEAHPLQGIGPGTYEFWWAQDARNPEFVRDAHSLYLEEMAELGVVGLLLLLGFFGCLVAAGLQARRRLEDPGEIAAVVALMSAFAVFMVCAGVDWMWEQTAVGCWVLSGSRSLRRARRSGCGAASAAALSLAEWRSCRHRGVCDRRGRTPGARDRLNGADPRQPAGRPVRDLPAAVDSAQDAIDAEPWAASPRLQLGLVYERQGKLEDARRRSADAAEREPENWRIPLVLARVHQRLGDRAAARRDYPRPWPGALP